MDVIKWGFNHLQITFFYHKLENNPPRNQPVLYSIYINYLDGVNRTELKHLKSLKHSTREDCVFLQDVVRVEQCTCRSVEEYVCKPTRELQISRLGLNLNL